MGTSSSKNGEDKDSEEVISYRRKFGWNNVKRRHVFQSSSSFNGVSQNEYEVWGSQRKRHNPSNLFPERRAVSFRSAEPMDGYHGLQCLLSPENPTPSRRFLSSSGSVNEPTFQTIAYATSEIPEDSSNRNVGSEDDVLLETEGDEPPDSPIPTFDPTIIATLEKAIDNLSGDDGWANFIPSEVAYTDSPDRFINSVHDHHPHEWNTRDANITFMETSACYRLNDSDTMGGSYTFVEARNYLDDFERKCPLGCENKTVLYFTSLRGVRKTYEDCTNVRLILKGYGVLVDERDVWMHSRFKEELASVVGPGVSVPQLFVKGRHIGGADVVKHLHEDGALGNLLEGLPPGYSTRCNTCADYRFIPCTSCNGSRKRVSVDDEVLLCPDCNENGLVSCPSCSV